MRTQIASCASPLAALPSIMTEPMQPATEPVIEESPGFFEEYKSQILMGTAAVVLLLGGYAIWQITSMNAREAAINAYAEARTAKEFAAVAEDHRGQRVAANALIQLSALLREEGNISDSDAALQNVLDHYPDHPLVAGALLGLAANREAAGEPDAAIEIYRQIPAKYAGSYAAPLARLAEARLLARDGKVEEAAIVYEDVVTSYPNTPAAMIARSEIAQLEAQRTSPNSPASQPDAQSAAPESPDSPADNSPADAAE